MAPSLSRRSVLYAGFGVLGTSLSGCTSVLSPSQSAPPLAVRNRAFDTVEGEASQSLLDAANTGHAPTATALADAPTAYWHYRPSEQVSRDEYRTGVAAPPSIVDGVAYVGDDQGVVHAIDARTGDQVWRRGISGRVRFTPAVTDTTVYVGNLVPFDEKWTAQFVALDRTDGTVRWRHEWGDDQPSANVSTVIDERVYVTAGRTLYAFSHDGEMSWSRPTATQGTPAARGESVLSDGVCYEGETGERRWAVPSSSPVTYGTLVDDCAVVAGGSQVRGLDLATGRERWVFESPDGTDAAYRPFTQPAATEKTVIVPTSDQIADAKPTNRIHALDLESGAERWSVTTRSRMSTPIIAGDSLLVSEDRALTAYDTATGDRQWRLDTSTRFWGAPTPVDGAVFIGSGDGLYALGAPEP